LKVPKKGERANRNQRIVPTDQVFREGRKDITNELVQLVNVLPNTDPEAEYHRILKEFEHNSYGQCSYSPYDQRMGKMFGMIIKIEDYIRLLRSGYVVDPPPTTVALDFVPTRYKLKLMEQLHSSYTQELTYDLITHFRTISVTIESTAGVIFKYEPIQNEAKATGIAKQKPIK
jgi:hypothetical protein